MKSTFVFSPQSQHPRQGGKGDKGDKETKVQFPTPTPYTLHPTPYLKQEKNKNYD